MTEVEFLLSLGAALGVPANARTSLEAITSTVSDGKTSRSCGTQPIPARARAPARMRARSRPIHRRLPPCTRASPISVTSSVVLPTPFRPSSAIASPALTVKLQSSTTIASP